MRTISLTADQLMYEKEERMSIEILLLKKGEPEC